LDYTQIIHIIQWDTASQQIQAEDILRASHNERDSTLSTCHILPSHFVIFVTRETRPV